MVRNVFQFHIINCLPSYEGESNETLKILIFFISQFIEHKRYTITSFFCVVSIAFHTSVPALRKCLDTSRKKIVLARSQPLVHRLLHLFVEPERLHDLPRPLGKLAVVTHMYHHTEISFVDEFRWVSRLH
jgi:hypothetical protein